MAAGDDPAAGDSREVTEVPPTSATPNEPAESSLPSPTKPKLDEANGAEIAARAASSTTSLDQPPHKERPVSRDESPAQKLEKVLKKQRAAENRSTPSRSRSRSLKEPKAAKPAVQPNTTTPATTAAAATGDFDDFGLPIRKAEAIQYNTPEPEEEKPRQRAWSFRRRSTSRSDADGTPNDHSRASSRASSGSRRRWSLRIGVESPVDGANKATAERGTAADGYTNTTTNTTDTIEEEPRTPRPPKANDNVDTEVVPHASTDSQPQPKPSQGSSNFAAVHARETSIASSAGNTMSEFSHQKLTTEKTEEKEEEDEGWQTMPAFAPYDMYDDDNRLIAKEHVETEADSYGYSGLGGAGKGYTRVLVDDDAESATSMDDNTNYLFKTGAGTSMMEDEEEQRDTVAQMEATKDLLTEGQRIAYVGITRLHLYNMIKELEDAAPTTSKRIRKELSVAVESMRMWSQKMMIRLYAHMDISLAEQVMIEQLSEHGVQPKDLTPALMANARVKNPMAHKEGATSDAPVPPRSPHTPQGPAPIPSPRIVEEVNEDAAPSEPSAKAKEAQDGASEDSNNDDEHDDEEAAEPPPPYKEIEGEALPDVRTPSQLPTTAKIDIDLRWTVLCDLFLVLIADSIYDARSRVLLERVGESIEIPWIDICKFERKVTEALEMQQQAEKENWDEKDHMEERRKLALRRRYVMMGLATVGGGLVIGLSAGLLAPVIGAGLAAGFTTIGVTGTSSFLAGAGGAAIITSSAAASGSVIGVRAANRRTGAVKTFEYRPLHNNKRVNLIVTVSGWMTGKVDDVRLPYSTIDPVMGDIYSVLWEPEMLTSMGDTINILATEALTQGLQQLLGSTILVSLMAALQLPVVLTKLSYLIDNPWAVSLDRATMAGLILADSLIDRNLGTRPITLVGYSLGSRVIFSCLQELARKGAYGLVQNVFMFGSPVVVKRDEYMRARSVVAGRLVNGYNRNDWILGYLFRLTNGGIRRVGGLNAVENIPGMENMDVTEFVVGHMDYRTAMPRLLRECGWLVESDEFTEIEDPDPENHGERQRELINEIEEARKELEKEGKASKKGGAFSFFSRKKKGEKQEWEIYEDLAKQRATGAGAGAAASLAAVGGRTEDAEGNNHGILFDVDAIRAELAKEHNGGDVDLQLEQLQVRELESTLPPMKLDYSPAPSPALTPPAPATTPKGLAKNAPHLQSNNRRVTDTAVAYRASHDVRESSSSSRRSSTTPTSAEYRHSDERTPTALGRQMSLPPRDEAAAASPSYSSYNPYSRTGAVSPHVVDHGNDGISMTFDYAYDDEPAPPRSASATGGTGTTGASASPLTPPTPFSPAGPPPPPPPKDPAYKNTPSPPARAAGPSSSGLAVGAAAGAAAAAAVAVTSPSVPAITLTDPWSQGADDDDDDFGKEQEISMTFA
ncbi:uncharacterized protein SPSK_00664 [Sporothrix schenckii 1099-18]|uniref:DUF726 domain protein n=2 Tax=Sporothrix schenckii TaxID=29908 RepID=U7PMT5_SPOS1|nr:uncharacterized protein SPSK_00664 [Sporothrix schenckii 1099-18]ERS96049.1 hypothetical protein HMPREF1624_07585 [Sporothrix schenckii ATCC 58251]KJR81684.1 hypothetical protein SPSK_00664 [Sporothrix schenckii 1099-18]